jgi:protocatechuate 3,4-dioxygenase beta subunit
MRLLAPLSSTLFLFLGISGLAQQQQAAKGGIEGIVASAGTGQPVSGAKVTVTRDDRSGPFAGATAGGALMAGPRGVPVPMASVTDDDGRFSFQNLEAGSYRLQAQGNGYVQQSYGQRYAGGPGTPITLSAGQNLKGVAVTLIPAGNVSGRIRDTSGEPLVNVPVQLLRYTYNATGQRIYQAAGTVRTDDRGEYRIYWVSPGRYYLRAGNPSTGADPLIDMMASMLTRGANGNPVPPTLGYAFYPGVTEIDGARALDIQAGAELQAIDLTLPSKPRTYRIRGRVIDSRTGQPPGNASVTALPNMPGLETGGVGLAGPTDLPKLHYNDANGTFEIGNLLPGNYSVIALIPDPTGSVPVTGDAAAAITDSDVEGIDILVVPAATITGRFQLDGQLPQSVTIERLSLVLITTAARGNGDMRFVGMRQPPNADGVFRLNDISPGEYRFGLQPDFGLYIKEARFEGRDVLNMPFNFSGSGSGTLDIVLARMDGRVTGVVRDLQSQPAPAVRVVIVPDRARQRTELYKVTFTDENGRFTFSGIAPGEYKVFSWDGLEDNEWYDPALLAQSEARGRPVHVTETSTETVEVTLIPAGGAR